MKDIKKEDVVNLSFKDKTRLYKFHVDKKKITLQNEDMQCYGIKVRPHSSQEMSKLVWKDIQLNNIEYSSSRKSQNVRHLIWAFRCLNAHSENIKEGFKNGIPCYRIEGYSKNNMKHKRLPILMGYVELNRWKPFIEEIMNKIKNQSNETY